VADTETAVREARAAGFANINLDVMFGLPGQTIESWMQTLRSLVALAPDHISCYALTVEPGTRFAHDIAREPALQPDDALQTAMAEAAEALLASAGYRRYEISNYAKPGMECRHNLLYWTDQDYLGLGPSAQSYIDGVRFGAMADVTSYVDSLQNGRLPIVDHIDLSAAERQRDALVFGLRLVEGVPQETVESALDTPASQRSLARLIGAGLVEACGERVRLTKLGRRYADTVAGELF
jgi:oxygen-independent coproporphyrinogen-3 oxidase